MWETKQFWGTIDFHGILSTVDVNGAQNNLVTSFLLNIYICVQQNKDIHTGLELLEGELITFTFTFIRRFYPKRLTVHSGYTFIVSMCVPWELNPQPLRC